MTGVLSCSANCNAALRQITLMLGLRSGARDLNPFRFSIRLSINGILCSCVLSDTGVQYFVRCFLAGGNLWAGRRSALALWRS